MWSDTEEGGETVDSEVDSDVVTEFHDPLVLRAKTRVGHVLRDKWRLDVLLGVGGMAAVYAATHRNGSRAAVKLLHSELSINPQVRTRFLREGYVANKVGHEGAVKVVDDDVAEDGAAFLVMELLDGETLEDRRLRFGGKLSEDDVLSVADQLLDVLAAAHAKGVVHRDLKPENIFVARSGQVKVLDFGIARLRELSTASTATKSGATMGTPYYMAPEQARGLWNEVDGRTDLWAVGATMYHLLSGNFVHDGRTANEVLLAAMTKVAAPLASVLPGVSPVVAHLVDCALAFEREKRWPDAARMQEALRHAYHDRNGVPLSTAPRLTVPETVPNRTLPNAQVALTPRQPTTGQPVARSGEGTPAVPTQPRFSRGAIVALVLGGFATIGLAVGIAVFAALPEVAATDLPAASTVPVPTGPPSAPARTARPVTPSPTTMPRPAPPNCDPPYTLDAARHRIPKPECN